jgi:hypothetical protein
MLSFRILYSLQLFHTIPTSISNTSRCVFLKASVFFYFLRENMSLVAVGSAWFLSSALLSTWANTSYLLAFKDPMLHTFIRFLGSALLGTITLLFTGEIQVSEIPTLVYEVSQPAVLLWLANYSNSMALQSAGITLTYVLKAGIPVFTVLVCSFSGQKFPLLIYLSLLPICLGVGLACMGDLSFSLTGFLAGLVSALSQTFMNISIKNVRNKTGYSGMKAFLGMTILATLITFPFMLASDVLTHQNNTDSGSLSLNSFDKLMGTYTAFQEGDSWPLTLTAIASLAYHIEYVLNFIFVGFVSSVAFSVSDIARRISIITIGSIVFQKKLSGMNWLGIAIALSGVLWYTYLENERNQKVKK